MGSAVLPNIKPGDIKFMENILSVGKIQHKYTLRIQAVLGRTQGQSTNDLALILGMNPMTMSRYVHRFKEGGIDSLLKYKTRKPGKKTISVQVKNELCRIVPKVKPENATHLSTRELAKRLGIGHSSVNTILWKQGLRPHLVKRFQFSTDPDFEKSSKMLSDCILTHRRIQ